MPASIAYRYDLAAIARRLGVALLLQPRYRPGFPDEVSDVEPYQLEGSGVDQRFITELPPEERGKTVFGQPYYSSLTFLPTRWVDPIDGTERVTPRFEIIEPRISVSPTRSMVVTQPVGRRDSVKEKISRGHKEISITGLLIGQDAIYPETARATLIEILSADCALRVDSDVLLAFGVTHIVIAPNGEKWGDTPYENVQEISLTAYSDEPYTASPFTEF
jgi:hypothetical protein